MIKADIKGEAIEVEMKGSWMEITAEMRAVLETYYKGTKENKGETYARAKMRILCSDVLAPGGETDKDRIKRWTQCAAEEVLGKRDK